MIPDLGVLFENAPIPLFYKDTKNNVLKVNNAFITLFGYTSTSDVENKQCDELFGAELSKRYYIDDLEIINSGMPKINIIEPLTTPAGNKLIKTDKVPYKDKDGIVIGIIGFALDITDSMIAQDELTNLKLAIEQSPSTVVITDDQGNIKYVNPKFSEVTGYHYTEVLNKNPRILKSGKLTTKQYKNMWDSISAGNIWRGEFLNKTKYGKLYWEIASIAPVKNHEGKVTSYIKVAEIVTDLRETMINLWNVLDFATYFVVVLDQDMCIRLANKSLSKFLGFEDEYDLIGKSWLEFIPNSEAAVVKHIHSEILNKNGQQFQEATTELINGNAEVIPIKWFNSNINHKYHMTFSLGTPVMAEQYKDNINSTREFFERILFKDKMTIQAIKRRIKNGDAE